MQQVDHHASPPRRVGFRAPLYRIGQNRCVDVPRRVSATLGARWRHRVAGTIAGQEFQTTLVPRGGGQHRLFISAHILRTVGLTEGDLVSIRIQPPGCTEEPVSVG